MNVTQAVYNHKESMRAFHRLIRLQRGDIMCLRIGLQTDAKRGLKGWHARVDPYDSRADWPVEYVGSQPAPTSEGSASGKGKPASTFVKFGDMAPPSATPPPHLASLPHSLTAASQRMTEEF